MSYVWGDQYLHELILPAVLGQHHSELKVFYSHLLHFIEHSTSSGS